MHRLLPVAFLLSMALPSQGAFRAGAVAIDIAPTSFPVRVNAMFTERSATQVTDPLQAKALALEDGNTRLVLCVVDTCMIPRDLIDRAKAAASQATGIPADRMLVSATHTHSAPSAMGCLGSRVDPAYAAFLPGRIAAALTGAVARLQPARVGWAQADAPDLTHNRRWIRRPDRLLTDPFGQPTVRANMHPGHQSPDAIGPSGPVDPQLSVLALQTLDGQPLALLANFSMHYYGSPLLSSDYFGRFARHVARELQAPDSFISLLSQGTSGDLMWMNYGQPRQEIGYDAYAGQLAGRAAKLVRSLTWREDAPLRMAESTLNLAYRVPDERRLAWAREKAAALGDRLPKSHPEIYALEALELHARQRTELKLQALRIGDLGITAIPNEVFALTGLKLKRQSPFAATMNIELANGAEGYIPPPEQHVLGGYTTWPARTAGLETNAEPRIVEAVLTLLESVAGQPRRPLVDAPSPHSQAVLLAKPAAFWRLEDMSVPAVRDAAGRHEARYEPGVALYLDGISQGRAAHFAGGRVRASLPLGDRYTVSLWVWNGLPHDARAVTGYFLSRGPDGDRAARGEHLGIGGTHQPGLAGRLIVFNGNPRNELLSGRTVLAQRAWHHVVLVRDGAEVRVHLDGRAEPEIRGPLALTVPDGETSLFLGGRNDGLFGLEGKLDEVAVFARALAPAEIAALHRSAGMEPPATATAPAAATGPDVPPLAPPEALKSIHVRPGYTVELAASEPLVVDPVAIDWGADGRLWVVEMADYPLGMDGAGKPGGRVRVLEDRNGDGRYDHATLFADGLNFPNGLLTWRDGVLVTAAPEVLFLRDTNGDGRADTREVLVSGLTTGNQQLRANGLRWGLDGWVYCAAGGHHGDYGVNTRLRTRAGDVLVGSRDFRFRPDTGELEPESGPTQFGRNRDDWGRWFGTQNSRPLWHYVLPDRYLARNPAFAAPDPRQQVVVPLNPRVWPLSTPEKRYHSFEHRSHYTSACGGMVYRDDLLFPRGPESHAFTCEPFHNLVQHHVLSPAGVSFTARHDPAETHDFFASTDRWCRPVMTRTGPDGALWVVDMYRYIIEHPDWLPKEGRAELLPHYRLGDDRGRLYRVFPANARPRPIQRLDRLDTAGLVAALDSPNEWRRDKAHMLLAWQADPKAIPMLEDLAARSRNPLARVHALRLAGTPKAVLAGLRDAHPGVRENALQAAERLQDPEVLQAALRLVDDPDPKVRLQLALSLGEWKSPAAGEALAQLALGSTADPFLVAAVLSSATPHAGTLTAATTKAGGGAQAAYGPTLARMVDPSPAPTTSTTTARSGKNPVPAADDAERAAVLARFRPALQLAGQAAAGRTLFTQRCASCHRLGEVGQDIGPNLVSVASHPPEKLLVNILNPSADVQPGYHAYECHLRDGTELAGLIASETATSITFRLADGTTRAVLRRDIASLQGSRASLMPTGLEAGLEPQDLANLIAFLRQGAR